MLTVNTRYVNFDDYLINQSLKILTNSQKKLRQHMAYERFRNISTICYIFAVLLVRQPHLLFWSHHATPPPLGSQDRKMPISEIFVQIVDT